MKYSDKYQQILEHLREIKTLMVKSQLYESAVTIKILEQSLMDEIDRRMKEPTYVIDLETYYENLKKQ